MSISTPISLSLRIRVSSTAFQSAVVPVHGLIAAIVQPPLLRDYGIYHTITPLCSFRRLFPVSWNYTANCREVGVPPSKSTPSFAFLTCGVAPSMNTGVTVRRYGVSPSQSRYMLEYNASARLK